MATPARHLASAPRGTIAISGSHGLIGSALCDYWRQRGGAVRPLLRRRREDGSLFWQPEPECGTSGWEGVEAVVHLAGENIARRRWSRSQKARLRQSRVEGTAQLVRQLAALPDKPQVLLCASAVGYYGHRGEERLDEESAAGTGFLAELCRDGEAAAEPARRAGIRVVWARLGVVLAPQGGFLPGQRRLFRLGLGGRLGDGQQWFSWIAVGDVVRAIDHLLSHSAVAGPVNLVAPAALRNAEWTAILAKVLRRPARLVWPQALLTLLLGEMAEGLALASARVEPRRLAGSGFVFEEGDLEAALRRLVEH